VTKLSKAPKELKELVSQVRILNSNLELLQKIIAISVGKDEFFQGKDDLGEKVACLEEFDLSDKIIAALVGSTPGSVKSTRSQKKAKLNKNVAKSEPKKEKVEASAK
jgi:hypothetical protein